MGYHYSQFFSLLTSGSTSTSVAVYVGDFRLLTLSVESKASLGASRLTVWGSNEDGLQNATNFNTTTSLNTGWSVISGINLAVAPSGLPAMFTFDPPGYRWLRVTVDPATQSAASYTTCTLNGVSF